MEINEWILYGEVGVSSKTIWAVMTGAVTGSDRDCWPHFDVPHDPADFRRCFLLLSLFPEWRRRLQEVGKVFPKWRPMVENWDKMEQLYREESPSGSCPKLYDLMQTLEDEGRILEGWEKTGSYSWTKTRCAADVRKEAP